MLDPQVACDAILVLSMTGFLFSPNTYQNVKVTGPVALAAAPEPVALPDEEAAEEPAELELPGDTDEQLQGAQDQ